MGTNKEPVLGEKSVAKRELILTGNIWRGVASVCFPLAIFQLLNQVFRLFDLSITAHIGINAMAAVSFFSQLHNAFASIGMGFAAGAGIIIAGHYGAGEYRRVKQLVNSVLCLTVIMAVLLGTTLILLAPMVMQLANTPAEFIEIGKAYYICEMAGLIFSFINAVYISIEKARGNGKIILWLNIILAVVKISLSALFVLVFHSGIVMISISTLMANIVVSIIGVLRLRESNDVFGLSLAHVSLRWGTLGSTVTMSAPIIAEKVAFSTGKVMVNSIGAEYGTDVVGALGVSNTISSLSTMPPSSIGDGGAAMIRQNLGAGNKNRALIIFRVILQVNLLVGLLGFLLTLALLQPAISIFAKGDLAFAALVKQIFMLEMVSNVFLAIHASVMGLLYGFGYTKLSFLLNFCRLFIFRLPLLILLQAYSNLPGGIALGLVMMVSNAATALASAITAVAVIIQKFGTQGLRDMWRSEKTTSAM